MEWKALKQMQTCRWNSNTADDGQVNFHDVVQSNRYTWLLNTLLTTQSINPLTILSSIAANPFCLPHQTHKTHAPAARTLVIATLGELDLENMFLLIYSGPATWNNLPSDLHDITDTSTFRKRLKSVSFDGAYHWLLLAFLDMSYSAGLQILHWLMDCWLLQKQTHA